MGRNIKHIFSQFICFNVWIELTRKCFHEGKKHTSTADAAILMFHNLCVSRSGFFICGTLYDVSRPYAAGGARQTKGNIYRERATGDHYIMGHF